MKYHFGTRLEVSQKPPAGNKHLRVLGMLVVAIFYLIPVVFLVGGSIAFVARMEHYMRVYQNPLVVEAEVTHHAEESDDDGTDYVSFISYTANGKTYRNIRYETKGNQKKLTPKGTIVTVEVSPEDPSQLIDKLASAQGGVAVMIPLGGFALAGAWKWGIPKLRSKGNGGTPDEETVRRDLRLTILSRFLPAALLLICAGYGLMYWRYAQVVGSWCLWVIVGAGAGWLCGAILGLRDMKAVKQGDYSLHRDVLVRKEYSTDSDGDPTYTLHYSTADRSWCCNVNQKRYHAAKEGTSVLAVYLPKKKKPILHYNETGEVY